jgi:hypothetical protein
LQVVRNITKPETRTRLSLALGHHLDPASQIQPLAGPIRSDLLSSFL